MLAFFDIESRSDLDLAKCGLWNYATHPSTQVVCMSIAFGDEPGEVWAPDWVPAGRTEGGAAAFERLQQHIAAGGYVVAHNAQFDRVVCTQTGLLEVPIDQTLCSQALCHTFNLPGGLGKAAATLRVPMQKDPKGKRLIRKICNTTTPLDAISEDEWAHFLDYALKDTLAMRDVWNEIHRFRPLSKQEWHEYHVVERLNDRGIYVDVEFARAAVEWADEETSAINEQLRELSGDPRMAVSNHPRKAAFLRELVTGTKLEDSCYATVKRKGAKHTTFSCSNPVRAKLLQRLDHLGPKDLAGVDTDRLRAFLQLLDEGSGVATKKFIKIKEVAHESRAKAQYRFNGAGQTGRLSSPGVQFQNVIREKLPAGLGQTAPALDAIDCIMGVGAYGRMSRGHRAAALSQWYGLPLQSILGRLIRPTIMAPDGRYLVWGDWSQIEARVLPWLAYAEDPLHVFRAFDAGAGPDVYKVAASGIFGVAPDAVDKTQRQVGKVATLALGFGGGVGAFQAMASSVGVKVSDTRADEIKLAWRAANPWAKGLWDALMEAALGAMYARGVWHPAGRVAYLCNRGTLYCKLPCGRLLTYPQARVEEVFKEQFDRAVTVITYRKVIGSGVIRGELYGGILAENVTQAAAASALRWLLCTLDAQELPCVATTHDEVLLEVPMERVDEATAALSELMTTGPAWAEGLPLRADLSAGATYGK
jgi:DNA polymerase